MKDTLKIAVTGGIGSGKSFALSVMKDAGYFTLSCDAIAAKLYGRHDVKQKLTELFPDAVTGREKLKADKKKIAAAAFGNAELLAKLNALMHPLIMRECFEKIKRSRARAAFVEVPLLFECGLETQFDEVMVVMRPLRDRIESVKTRSSLSEVQIMERISNQTDYAALNTEKYIILTNDGNADRFKQKILSACEKILCERCGGGNEI